MMESISVLDESSSIKSSPNASSLDLLPIVCGPILRQVTTKKLVIWWVMSKNMELRFRLGRQTESGAPYQFVEYPINESVFTQFQVGKSCFICLMALPLNDEFKELECVYYDIEALDEGKWSSQLKPLDIGYQPLSNQLKSDDQKKVEGLPYFIYRSHIDKIFHGSCRKIHDRSCDALVALDHKLERENQASQRPAMLLMSGDQVYVDDVAGPVLSAIHQIIQVLGLYSEQFDDAVLRDSDSLYNHPDTYYKRGQLIPTYSFRSKASLFFRKKNEPVLSSKSRDMHLFTLAEVIGLYLLTWSPELWSLVDWRTTPPLNNSRHERKFKEEVEAVQSFVQGISRVRRLMSNFPTYMIFDDHDVTDDWNLSALWEKRVYGKPVSKQIIGNALFGYFLFQGWGNAPQNFSPDFMNTVKRYCEAPTHNHHQSILDCVLKWDKWGYVAETSPKMVVLDTRTQRWRSEFSLSNPSGLMDWESLTELQQSVLGEQSVILVSAAPIFGVKLIETLQRVMTWLGLSLHVDAENWMAHPGSAMTILNIFTHKRTPKNFIVLSGDVHYSFVYEIVIRFRKNSPRIWQITASGIKNEFPEPLLTWMDGLNRIFYGVYSPLNVFTKRKHMHIRQRDPSGAKPGCRLVNKSAIGVVDINKVGIPTRVGLLTSEGDEIHFPCKRNRIKFWFQWKKWYKNSLQSMNKYHRSGLK